MKLPNGYGSIEKLSGNRRKPYSVRVTLGYDENGKQLKKRIGIFASKKEALNFLLQYKADPSIINIETLKEVFEEWSKSKYKGLSRKSIQMYDNAWNYLKVIQKMNMRQIKTYHIQSILDNNSDKSKSLQRQIKCLAGQLYKYALKNDLADKNYAEHLEIKGKSPGQKQIFTDQEIQTLWDNKEKEGVDSILLLIYTGMRIGELVSLTKFHINLKDEYIRHGSKTQAGQDRIIPLHPKILPFIEKRMGLKSEFLFPFPGETKKMTVDYYRKYIYYRTLKELNLPRLTPHCCRHTYSSLLNKSVSNKEYIMRLMGHTDYSLTANVYTHSDIEELKKAVQSIQ